MGIRFLCPNGHKLNVKNFQSGRRGVCPHCGVGVFIPTKSTRVSSRKRKGPPDTPAVSAPSAVCPPPCTASPDKDDLSLKEDTEDGRCSPPEPLERPVVEEAPGALNLSETPSLGLVDDQKKVLQPPPRPAGRLASLDEAGEVAWYLRPPSGGQYGPATREIMRTWLAEGRITPDSRVWHEGWQDWKEASAVFPQSSFRQVAPTAPVSDAMPELESILGQQGDEPLPAWSPPPRRGPSLSRVLVISVLVLVLVVALGAAALLLIHSS